MGSAPKIKIIAGVDEAGRGPLAGPVVAAAVILDPKYTIEGLNDSKVLTERKRESLFGQIKDKCLSWGIGVAQVEEIDNINILQATLLAMRRAVFALHITPDEVWVDGNQPPKLTIPVKTIVRGDQTVAAISAASILAKVTRDALMVELDACHPGYGFADHKGYPTESHIIALNRHGVTPIHRRTFGPVKQVLENLLEVG